jgi:hypothetical protein
VEVLILAEVFEETGKNTNNKKNNADERHIFLKM